LGVEYPSYPCRQKVQILLFKSKWDTLSVLKIENEKYSVSKNRGAAPLNQRHCFPAIFLRILKKKNAAVFIVSSFFFLM
jgi:hypothetical protein